MRYNSPIVMPPTELRTQPVRILFSRVSKSADEGFSESRYFSSAAEDFSSDSRYFSSSSGSGVPAKARSSDPNSPYGQCKKS